MPLLKKLLKSLLVGSLAGLALALFTSFFFVPLFDRMEWLTYDMRYVWEFQDFNLTQSGTTKEDAGYGIHIIDIDDRSFQKMGVYWHWDRSYHAQLLNTMEKHHPAAVLFDILFFDPEDSFYVQRVDKLFARVEAKAGSVAVPDAVRQSISAAVDYDGEFVQSIRDLGAVYTGIRLAKKNDYSQLSLSQIQERFTLAWHDSLKPSSAISFPPDVRKQSFNPSTELPIIDGTFPRLAQASKDIGYVNVEPDKDGTIRSIPIMYAFGNFAPVYLPISIRTGISLFATPAQELKFLSGKYFDIGKPFKVFKDSSGILSCSYPNVTPAQVKAIIDHKDAILACTPGKSVEVSSLLKIGKNEEGNPFIEMYCGYFPVELVNVFCATSMDSVRALQLTAEKIIAEDIAVSRTSEDEWTITTSLGDGGYYLSSLDLKTLARVSLGDFKELAPNSKKLLFYGFTVRNRDGILTSNIPVLRDQSLTELCATPWSTLEGIKNGSRMDFGKSVVIPVNKDNLLQITYFGKQKTPFPYYSYYDIYANRVQGGLEGKIFIIGSSVTAMFDITAVPFDKLYPAVEIHASILNSLMTNTFITKLEPWENFIILLLVGIVIGFLGFALKPLPGAILSVVAIFAYFLAAMQLFGSNHLWIEIARPVLTILLTYTAVMAYRYITEEKDRKFLQSTFKQYLSPELIDIMYKKKQMPQLGGDEGIRTAYFTDIQGFSTFSEKLGSPTRLVELLNEYLTGMTDILLGNLGTLDKYEGDAIIAFFGAPMQMEDHAVRACGTALDMQKKLGELRQKWISEGDKWPRIVHEMRMRIGVNTGPIVTGNMGSKMRMNYTMMGDAVNLAARLEGAAKQYGVFTMISDTTWDLVKDSFEARQLDKITVVGKSEPVVVHELLARKGELTDDMRACIEVYRKGLELFYSQQWDAAITTFTESEKLEPYRAITSKGVTPSRVFIDYCMAYKKDPPGDDWDGVNKLTSK